MIILTCLGSEQLGCNCVVWSQLAWCRKVCFVLDWVVVCFWVLVDFRRSVMALTETAEIVVFMGNLATECGCTSLVFMVLWW